MVCNWDRILFKPILIVAVFFFSVTGSNCNAAAVGQDMILIPAGPFFMGSSDKDIIWAAKQFHSESLDWYRDETPIHEVTLPSFKIVNALIWLVGSVLGTNML